MQNNIKNKHLTGNKHLLNVDLTKDFYNVIVS